MVTAIIIEHRQCAVIIFYGRITIGFNNTINFNRVSWVRHIKQLCQQLIKRLKESHLPDLNVRVYGDDAHVLADEHFIERAIENLILNGKRYANNLLEIHVIKQKNTIQICIEDDGMGVYYEIREKISSPFFRPDESLDRQKGGAGLGLAIVKKCRLASRRLLCHWW